MEPVPARFRMAVAPAYEVINGFVLDPFPSDSRFLDPNTGAISRFHTPEGERLDYASCSPWETEDGEYQLVGRWTWQGKCNGAIPTEDRVFGLERFSLPSGRVLDQIPLDVVPASIPCWFPGMTARVLFAGSDGQLYRLAFGRGPGASDEANTGPHRPSLIAWRGPALEQLMTRDPVWPADPRLGGRLIASVSYRAHKSDDRLIPTRLWWLQLAPDGSAVVDGGCLTDPEEEPRLDRGEERYPNLTLASDGRLVLAYLHQPPQSSLWELHLAAVQFDTKTGKPTVHTADDRVLTPDHLAAQPPFSADGRHVFGIIQGDHRFGTVGLNARVVKYPVNPTSLQAHAARTATVRHRAVAPRG
jgi:hypothetical protein